MDDLDMKCMSVSVRCLPVPYRTLKYQNAASVFLYVIHTANIHRLSVWTFPSRLATILQTTNTLSPEFFLGLKKKSIKENIRLHKTSNPTPTGSTFKQLLIPFLSLWLHYIFSLCTVFQCFIQHKKVEKFE